jgi:hypothetical protein
MTRRVSRNSKYNQDDFERDLDELSRLIDEQNQDGGRRQRRNDNNDNNNNNDDQDQDGGRRQRQRDNRRRNNNNRNDDDNNDDRNDDDNNDDNEDENNNQEGGKKKRVAKKSKKTAKKTAKKTVKKTKKHRGGAKKKRVVKKSKKTVKKTVKRTKKHHGSGKHEKTHRTFTLVEIDGRNVKSQGVYRIKDNETPLKAAERAYSKLFKKAGEKKMNQTFKLRETSRYGGDKKVFGPYVGKSNKLKTPKKIVRGGSTITIEWEHHVELK